MKNNLVNFILNFFLLLNLTSAGLNFGSPLPEKELTLAGNAAGDSFGYTVGSGDINGDGFDDIIIGAYSKDFGQGPGQGRVYVIYGGKEASLQNWDFLGGVLDPLTTGFTITGNEWNDLFGVSIGTGDIDGDGYDDIIIGAYGKNCGQGQGQGQVYVIYGGNKPDLINRDLSLASMALEPQTTGFTITGESSLDKFGFSVSTGDVDNDGYDDIIVGASGKNNGLGQVYVIYGGPRLSMSNIDFSSGFPSAAGFIITGEGTMGGDSFGYSVRTRKINEDDHADIIIGAPYYDNSGSAYVIYGQKRTDFPNTVQTTALSAATTGFKLTGEASSRFGYSVAAADVTGDGLDDIIIGAHRTSTVFVIYGKSAFSGNFMLGVFPLTPATTGFTVKGGGTSSDWFGSVVNNAGDINQDDHEDIIIGAPYKDSDQGAVYVVYGGDPGSLNHIDFSTLVDPSKAFSIPGNPTSQLGMSACGGDINNDGFFDFIIGAPQENSAYVLFYNLCSDYCKTCTNPSTCDVCSVGYGNQGSLCASCPSNCDECSSVSTSVCDLCSQSFFLNQVSGVCGASCPQYTIGLNRVCENCPVHCETCTNSTFCNGCSTGYYFYNGRCELPCPLKTFTEGLTCKDCPTNCDSCSSETVCNACGPGFVVLDGQCVSECPGAMFNSGGTCADCPSNCESCSSMTSCDVCSGLYLLDQDLGQCVPSCPTTKFEFHGVCKKCVSRCETCSSSTACEVCTSPYLLHQGQCVDNCPSTTFQSNRACESCPDNCDTCSDSTSCGVCTSPYLLYQDQCVGSCPVKTFTSNHAACHDCREECSECTNESTCQGCIDGYTLTESHLCVKQTEEEIPEKDDEKAAAGVFEGTSLIGASLSSGSSLPLNFGLVAKILRNFKYMDIPVSRELQETFVSWKVASGFMSAPKSWNKKYTSKELPTVFSRYGLQSAFLINFWKPFSMALVGAGLFGIFKAIEIFLNKKNDKKTRLYSISRQVNVAASNFALTQFYSNLDDVIFYFVIEARSLGFDTGFKVFSLIFAVVILMGGGLLVGLHIKFVGKYQNLKGKKELEAFISKSENVNLIFKDFKDTTSFTQSFLLINVIRSVISSFIFAVFFQHPVLQIFMLFVLNMIMLAYLWVKRPFKDLVSSCGQIFCEVVLLIANICVFIMVIFDQSDSDPIDSIRRLSKCIIVLNFILLFGCAFLMLANIGKSLYQSYQEKKKTKVIESRVDNSEIFTSAKFSRPKELVKSDQNLGQSATTDFINESHNKPETYGNVLETSVFKDNNCQSNLGSSNTNYYFQNQANINMENIDMSSSNVIFQASHTEGLAETSQTSNNILLSSPQIRSHPKPKMKVPQEENLRYGSPESKIQDPLFHSKMALDQEMTMDQDIFMTNYEQAAGGEAPLRAEIVGSPNLIPRRKIRKNEDFIFRGIGK